MADAEVILKKIFSLQPNPHDLGLLVEMACVLEVYARKPGNVHPSTGFADTAFNDFVSSASAISPVFDQARWLSTGELIIQAVRATRQVVDKNTNLGIILALAPLAKAPTPDQAAVQRILSETTVDETRLAYQAIREASPGGLGTAEEQDVYEVPTVNLLQAMQMAAERDLIARQYTTAFHDVFHLLLPELLTQISAQAPLEQAIIHTFLVGLARLGDTLIFRKCGTVLMEETKRRAGEVLRAGGLGSVQGREKLRKFDDWLRGDGNRRNPGAMADLLAATLFLALRRGSISVPITLPWSCGTL